MLQRFGKRWKYFFKKLVNSAGLLIVNVNIEEVHMHWKQIDLALFRITPSEESRKSRPDILDANITVRNKVQIFNIDF